MNRRVRGGWVLFQFSIGDAGQERGVHVDIHKQADGFNSLLEMLYVAGHGGGPLQLGVSILYWRCIHVQVPRHEVRPYVTRLVSILYWRCGYHRRHEGVHLLDGFNSLLEMPQWCRLGVSARRRSLVSILYWRCPPRDVATWGALRSSRFNSLLEMHS